MTDDSAERQRIEPVTGPVQAALDGGDHVCRVWPEQEEGPYHRDEPPVRRNVVEDAPGLPLVLGLRLVEDTGGGPLTTATIEIWHCDAYGRYSGFPPPNQTAEYVPDRTFLRGAQSVDETGSVEFRTVYPGWYPGRTIHVHVRAHVGAEFFTSQLYFPEDANAAVLARPPYSERPGRDTTNDDDPIAGTGNGPAVLQVTASEHGYLATACMLVPT